PVFPTAPLWNSHLLARAGGLLSCGAVVALLAWTIWRSQTPARLDLAFGLALTAMLLVSPICWDHYFLLLLLPWVLVWRGLRRSALARGLFLLLSIAFWAPLDDLYMVAIPVTEDHGRLVWDAPAPWQTLTVLSFQCYALLGLFVLLLIQWRRE